MENISNDKIIENEINSFIDIALHLDSYLLKGKIGLVNLNNKIKKFKLSQNSIDLLNQMISSEKFVYFEKYSYLCTRKVCSRVGGHESIT